MVVKMSLKQVVRMKHKRVDAIAGAFIRGVCFAILCYCVIYTYFFIIK